MSSKKTTFIVLAILILAAVAYFIYANRQDTKNNPTAVTVYGETACLPHKAGVPATEECRFGFKISNMGSNKYYALKNISGNTPRMDFGKIVGLLTLGSNSEYDRYDIVGIIEIQSATKIEKSVVVGTIEGCLPHSNVKPGEVESAECRQGFKTEKGSYTYDLLALSNSSDANWKALIGLRNPKVELTGYITDENIGYESIGHIHVENLRVLK